ncbi:penicillin acylase family protein [Nocardioides speluncae]|uniref:penicillin acylase family protein n=1 Tax=Nocardioides speluncae TaxID=2670337 RepID=UPI000D68A6A9|nr:penicillin acylase family protein [Nocardioides speluncae]
MTVYRDAWGIPHVRAESVTELAFEQGRATAADRAWQLEIGRLRAEGRTATLVGEAGVEWDRFARRTRLAETAQRAYDALSAEAQAFVSAYVDGVNAAVDGGLTAVELDELDATPGQWQPWTPLGVFLVQHILFGSIASKLWRQRVADVAGEEALDLLRTEGLPHGSNAYAVAGGLTASGRPLVAGDPHRLFEDPNVYAQVRLACPEFDVVGFAFPGVPGVQHFAHAGEVAWGVTNAAADYQDVYLERLERRDGGVWALGPDGWEECAAHVEKIEVRDGAPVEVEVIVTGRGPVFLGEPHKHAMSARTTSWALGDLGFEALLPLLRARTVADVDLAFAHWVEPVNNFVIADSQGTVLHRVGGKVPQRPEPHWQLPADGTAGHGWTGWVEPLPRTPVPADGRIVTANDRISEEYAEIGDDFAPSYRADRITELLDGLMAGRTDLTAEQAGAVLTDTHQNAGQVLLAAIKDLADLEDAADDVRRRLLEWDGAMDADSAGAALYSAVRDAAVARICAAPDLAMLHEENPYGDLWAPWFRLAGRVAVSLHVILQVERPFGLDRSEVLRGALADVAAVPAADAPDTWGAVHTFHAIHELESFGIHRAPVAPATPMPGDSDCVVATSPLTGTTLTVRGPVARYVWDLADRPGAERGSLWAVPLGAAGDPHGVHHHDQHDLWTSGRFVPVVTDWDQLEEER